MIERRSPYEVDTPVPQKKILGDLKISSSLKVRKRKIGSPYLIKTPTLSPLLKTKNNFRQPQQVQLQNTKIKIRLRQSEQTIKKLKAKIQYLQQNQVSSFSRQKQLLANETGQNFTFRLKAFRSELMKKRKQLEKIERKKKQEQIETKKKQELLPSEDQTYVKVLLQENKRLTQLMSLKKIEVGEQAFTTLQLKEKCNRLQESLKQQKERASKLQKQVKQLDSLKNQLFLKLQKHQKVQTTQKKRVLNSTFRGFITLDQQKETFITSPYLMK